MNIFKSIFRNLFREEFASLESQLKLKQEALVERQQALIARDVTIHQLRQTNEQLSSLANSSNQEIDNLRNQVIILENNSEEYGMRIDHYVQQIESYNSQKRVFEIRIQELTQSHKDEVNRLNGLLTESNGNVAILSSKNEALKSEKQALSTELNELRFKVENEELLTALKNDIRQKQEIISNLESDIQHLNEELSSTREEKDSVNSLLNDKKQECDNLKNDLRSMSAQNDDIDSLRRDLNQHKNIIAVLKKQLTNKETELIERENYIGSLESQLQEKKNIIKELEKLQGDTPEHPIKEGTIKVSNQKGGNAPEHVKPGYRKRLFPHLPKRTKPSKDVITIDFPVIENENIYSRTSRSIDKVFNHRTKLLIQADDIFLHKPAEELSRLGRELIEAVQTGKPYLTCPCCGKMVKISCRTVRRFGLPTNEVQYFTHAEKNVVCDLKRDNSYNITIDGRENGENDFSYLKELRRLLANSLRTELSQNKGFFDVKDCVYVLSDELPIMKRRLADVTARYNDLDIVLELVTPSTNIAKVHDRDIFYLINRKQVFWVFGLESIVDYNELKRFVSKDILFTNKRNVFVFDIEAQEESKRRGELMLKCNWLDEDGAWYYQIEKNGKNGILVSLDQIHFEEDSCRPYFYDADEPYYLKNPTAERPLKLTREKLKQDIIEVWNYEQQRNRAVEEMLKDKRGVEAYSEGEKWGFKYGDVVFVEPTFDSKPLMLGDFAKVEKDGKYGVINRYGDYRLQTEYDEVALLPNGYILYASKGNWYLFGVIDSLTAFTTDDDVVVTTISKTSSIYHLIIKKYLFEGQQPEEFYFVGNDIFKKNSSSGKWNLWQSNGERITNISWDSLEFTSEETIKVSSNGRTQLLALDGTVIEEQKYKSESKLANGYSIVETFDEYWGMTDSNGLEIVVPEYDVIIALNTNFLKIQRGNNWGIITSTGQIIVEPIYRSVDGFDGECFVVSKLNETRGWGFLSGKLDYTGRPVSEVISQSTYGVSITKSFEKYGLERNGNVIVPHMYDNISYWGENKYIAQKDDKFGIIDSRNRVLLNFEYTSITPLKEGKSTLKRGSSQKELDSNLKIVEECVIELQEGYKKIRLGGKWGIINPEGQVIVDYLYDEISTFRGRLVGIINGRLIKLNAYYPYRLAMNAKSLGIVDSRDLIMTGGVLFQNIVRRSNPTKCKEEIVILVNWTSSMKYPVVCLYDKDKYNKRAKHIDKPSDFIIGDKFDVTVKSIITGKGIAKGKRKGVEIELSNGMKSYIYKNDFNKSGIDINSVGIGDKFTVTKFGYDEDLDRTQWSVKAIL